MEKIFILFTDSFLIRREFNIVCSREACNHVRDLAASYAEGEIEIVL